MNIVIEGPDNTGKSTLAEALSKVTGWSIVGSEGREKWPNEINQRVERYFENYNGVIFDRHPCVSQAIYDQVRSNTAVSPHWIMRFYAEQPLIIYCRPRPHRGMIGHQRKTYDDESYLEEISEKYHRLAGLYDHWALQHAHIIHQFGVDPTLTTRLTKGWLNYVL